MQNRINESTPMTEAVSPRTRAKLERRAQTNNAGSAIQGDWPMRPPAKQVVAPAAAKVAIARARARYGPPGSASIASQPPNPDQISSGRRASQPASSGTANAVAVRRPAPHCGRAASSAMEPRT